LTEDREESPEVTVNAGGDDPWEGWQRWLQTPPGRYLLAWEEAAIDDAVVDVFGFNAIQCGAADLDFLRSNRMPNRHRVQLARATADSNAVEGRSSVVIDQFEELPFATHSLDLVVLPHVLEFATDPYQVLREVDRVLRPEGRMVVTGFNPVSLWGLRETVGQAIGSGFLPHQSRLITLMRLRDWLRLLGYAPSDAEHGCFRPACRSERWLARFNFVEAAGDRWWPILGASYLQSAVKRFPGMTLQGPVWRKRFAARASAPVTSHRGTCSRETAEEGLPGLLGPPKA
jgi:SAM-dependent methyltransferase